MANKQLLKLKPGKKLVTYRANEFASVKVESFDPSTGLLVLEGGEKIDLSQENLECPFCVFGGDDPEKFFYIGYDYLGLVTSLTNACTAKFVEAEGMTKGYKRWSKLNEKIAKLIWKWYPKLHKPSKAADGTES